MKTLTVEQLIEQLKKVPKEYRVFIGADPEGNNYGTLDSFWSIQNNEKDKTICIMPFESGFTDYEVAPKIMNQITKELIEDAKLGKEVRLQ